MLEGFNEKILALPLGGSRPGYRGALQEIYGVKVGRDLISSVTDAVMLAVIVKAWRESWEYVVPFVAFEPEVRRVPGFGRARASSRRGVVCDRVSA